MIKLKTKLEIFPLLQTLKGYTWRKFKADFWAGINVSLLDFPQAMAYALLAGFPIMFGVYASTIGSLIGPFFSSSNLLILGTTNATAVLVLSSFLTLNIADEQKLLALPVLILLVGLFMVIGALLKLAGLIKYVSRTVIIGYITAAALLIIVNQLSTILGTPRTHAATFFEVIMQNAGNWKEISLISILVGFLTGCVYMIFRSYSKFVPTVALTLLSVSILTFFLNLLGLEISMIESQQVGLWMPKMPEVTFELIYQMGGPAIALAFLAILESSSIAKTLAAKTGSRVDLNQNMLSMGMCNIASAFSSGMPVSGSLTRSILNFHSGALTGLSSVFSGVMMIMGILLLGPLLQFIPKASLATIVVFIGISLINLKQIQMVVKATKADCAVFFVTFCGGLIFPLNIAIALGASASIVLFLKKISEPRLMQYIFNAQGELSEQAIKEPSDMPEISIVHVEGELFFGSTDIFLDQTRLICASPNLKVIILRMRNATDLDASSAFAVADLIRYAHEKDRYFIVTGANAGVERVFHQSGVMEILGENNFFRYTPENPNLAIRHALKRAQELIGQEQARILLFTSPGNSEKMGGESVQEV